MIEKRQQLEKNKLLEELRKIPIISFACQRTGIARATFYRWCNTDSQFADDVEEASQTGREILNDLCESQLVSLIKDKKWEAIRYYLDNNHPKYIKPRQRVVVEHSDDSFRVEIPYDQSQ